MMNETYSKVESAIVKVIFEDFEKAKNRDDIEKMQEIISTLEDLKNALGLTYIDLECYLSDLKDMVI